MLEPSTSVSEFLATYWETRHLYAAAAEPARFAHLLSPTDLDAYLARNDVRFPSLKMVKDGNSIPTNAYSRPLKLGTYQADDWVDMDRVFANFAGGATIVLQLLQNSFDSVVQPVNELMSFFRCRVDVHAFITPSTSQGLSAHYDTASAFLIQLRGKKRWLLYENEIEAPLSEHSFNEHAGVSGQLVDDVTLSPGDVLYLPRGVPHNGVALGEMSVHLTVVLFPQTWIDLLSDTLALCEQDPAFRRAPITAVGIKPDLAQLADTWNQLGARFESTASEAGRGLRPDPNRVLATDERRRRFTSADD